MADRNSNSKSSLPKAYDVEAREREERKRKRRDGEEGREDFDSFPVMMSFKAFLETQDDSITDEEALAKYGEYKLEFRRQKINEFFVSHKTQEWFRLKYQPQELEKATKKEQKAIRRRCEIFQELSDKGFLEGVSCDDGKEMEIIKLLDSVVILLEGGNYEDIKNLDLEQNNNDAVKHKSSSIFIKNLHPSITRDDLHGIVSKYPGFLRLAISEADAKIGFSRRCWVSFQRNAKIREICFALNNVQLKGLEFQAVVNKDLSRRTRTTEDKVNLQKVLETDFNTALAIIKFQDEKHGVWVEEAPEPVEPAEGDAPPEVKVEKVAPVVRTNPLMSEVEKSKDNITDLKSALDKLVLYLRVVHSIDFYGQKDYSGEDEMPNRCGLIHVRPSTCADYDEAEVCKFLNSRVSLYSSFTTNTIKMGEAEAKKLGLKDEDFEIEKFISANSQELAKDKWLCTLSGKKFKAVEFVKKHIVNKFPEKVEEVKTEVKFFNTYILDPSRPQIPEEKARPPPPAKKMRQESEAPTPAPLPAKKSIHERLGVREQVTSPRSGVRVTHANSDPRGLIDYSDIDSSVFDLFG